MLEIERLSDPFQKFSRDLVASNMQVIKKGMNHPFIVFTERAKSFCSIWTERFSWLMKTEEALRSFKKRIDKIEETRGVFHNLREARDRTSSGYISDILVVIPDSNRKVEYQIYDAFGEVLRTSRPLLFDLHLIKLKGRKLEEVTPKGFWRYE